MTETAGQARGFSGRREDTRFLTGQGRYTADFNLPGQAHAAFLRSDRAHARIRSLDLAAARAAPGVLAIFSGEDARNAGLFSQPSAIKFPGIGGRQIKVPKRYALPTDRVRFVGECVAMVVAENAYAAADALERISIDYEDLPAVIGLDAALAEGAERIHEEIERNLSFELEYGDQAQVAAVFSRAAHKARVVVESQRLIASPIEPRSCIANWDAASDTCDIYCPNQGISIMRERLGAFARLPAASIRVHGHDVGGSFGNRSAPYPEYVMALLAARTLGRPVKWTGTRSESMLSDNQGRGIRLQGELALDNEGHFLALQVRVTGDLGAFHSDSGPICAILMPRATLTGAYRIPVAYGRHQLALTNCVPVAAYRGAGRPDIAYLVERLVDEAARQSGIERIELRRRNVIPRSAFPYKTLTSEYDSADFDALVDKAVGESDWQGFETRRAASKARGKLRGIGCAVFIEPAGGGPHPTEQAALRFSKEGLTLYLLAGSSGQGHETVFPEIVADALGIPAERVTLCAFDPPDGPALVGHGTIGSRSMMSHGSALAQGSREVIRKGLELASRELEVALIDLEFEGGEYRVKGTDRRVGLLDLARRYAGADAALGHPLDTTGEAPIRQAFPSGAHVVEVEVDPETGAVELQRYVAVDDCGRVLNHVLLEAQLHGGIAQGVGQVLGEHALYDPASGQLLSGSLMDYPLLRSTDLPTLRVFDCSVPSPNNLLGVKGVGEAGTAGGLAATTNAILDALRPAGVTHLDLPLTPGRVWGALHEARRKA